MQSVNDDMDDLWRKAGSEYPLNTGGADWDKVAARLGIEPEPKRKDRRYLWLLLLLLIPVLCIRPFPLGLGGNAGEAPSARNAESKPPTPARGNKTSTQPDRSSTDGGPALTPVPAAGDKPGMPASSGATAGSDRTATPATATPAATAGATPAAGTVSTYSPGSPHVSAAATAPKVAPASPATKIPIAGGGRKGRRSGTDTRTAKNSAPRLGVRNNAPPVVAAPVKQPSVPGSRNDAKPDTSLRTAVAQPAPPVAKADSAKRKDSLAAPSPAILAKVDSPAVAPPAVAGKKPTTRPKRFYAGVVAGTGITTVKRQKVQAPGYDVGIALGYQFNRHFALEANLLWSRKHYYSHGKYLKNDLSYLPQYSYVRTVDGDCRMIEIPVNLQYHFRFRKQGNWFATAGFSSYLMKREEYGYNIKNLLTSYEGHYDTTLRNATRDWMAMLQLSAGYRFQLRRQLSLRVEPYVQLPVHDAGAGRLPLTSYGLRVALLKNIF